ncbi:FAD-binding oxidoreductase [Chloroflexota bacterium]
MDIKGRYSKISEKVMESLTGIVGAGNVLTGKDREDYSHDEMPGSPSFLPEAVVKPEDTASVAAVLRLANENKIPVTPRGAGTGLSGGAVPVYGGIVLSLEKMNKILEIDSDNFTAVVESGVILSKFYEAVEEKGLFYPTYPGETSATIGGNAATNAGGMRAVKYGVTRQAVLGLEAVLANGEIINTGGKYVKSSTGYDLTQLIIGSEGTLAVVTKVILKLIPSPGKQELLLIPFNSLSDAIGAVPQILKEGILPVGIEFMEKDIIEMVEDYTGTETPLHGKNAFLLIFVEADSEDEIYTLAGKIDEICAKCGADDIFIPKGEAAKKTLLEMREKFYPVISNYGMLDLADVVVPRSKIAEFVEKAKEIAAERGIKLVAYGHAGDGNVHLHPLGQKTDDTEGMVKELFTAIYQAGIAMGGTISGEHGLGFAKKGYFTAAEDKGKLELMKRIKLAFDPNNILNPGKVLNIE